MNRLITAVLLFNDTGYIDPDFTPNQIISQDFVDELDLQLQIECTELDV